MTSLSPTVFEKLGLFYLGWPKEGFEWPTSPRTPAWEKLKWN